MLGAMDAVRISAICRRALPWCAGLYLLLLVFPIQVPLTRAFIVLGALVLWASALVVWWKHRWARVTLIAFVAILVAFVALPGRPADAEGLRADYRRGLSMYGMARYVWGGETFVGIDCSGFVREGLALGQLVNGVRTLNGTPIRDAISMWWNDSTAEDLRDGGGGSTQEIGRFESVNEIDEGLLEVGDLAATADGVHVLVYVGDSTWMEADPLEGRVVTATTPSTIGWFETPVVLLRWTALTTG